MSVIEYDFKDFNPQFKNITKSKAIAYIKHLHKTIKDLEIELEEKNSKIKSLNFKLGMFYSVNQFINEYGYEKLKKQICCTEKQKTQEKVEFAIAELEKIKIWSEVNSITVFYNELETEIKEKHIVVDRPQENGSPSLIKRIEQQIKEIKIKNI